MNDEQTVILIESINLNPNLSATQKLDLVRKTMSDCREKQIGKILVEAVKKVEKTHKLINTPIKRGRGRPRKLSPNAQRMIYTSREIDRNNGVGHE